MKSIYSMYTSIIKHICIKNILNQMNGLLFLVALNTRTIGIYIILNINVKDYVKRLYQNILNYHLKYVNLIFLKL